MDPSPVVLEGPFYCYIGCRNMGLHDATVVFGADLNGTHSLPAVTCVCVGSNQRKYYRHYVVPIPIILYMTMYDIF